MMKLAYLCDVFGQLNELNLQLQGTDKYLPHLADSSFIRKLEMWHKRLQRGNIDCFENLSEFVESNYSNVTTVIPCLKELISLMKGYFQKYFPDNSAQYDWVRNPFSAAALADFSSAEEEEYIEMTSDSSLRLKFPSPTLSEFWIGVEREHPHIGQRAVSVPLCHFLPL